MKIDYLSIEEIEARHPGCHIETNSLGLIFDDERQQSRGADDVLVWATESDSIDDDGSNAIARYTIAA